MLSCDNIVRYKLFIYRLIRSHDISHDIVRWLFWGPILRSFDIFLRFRSFAKNILAGTIQRRLRLCIKAAAPWVRRTPTCHRRLSPACQRLVRYNARAGSDIAVQYAPALASWVKEIIRVSSLHHLLDTLILDVDDFNEILNIYCIVIIEHIWI